jgi:hypothetical protein
MTADKKRQLRESIDAGVKKAVSKALEEHRKAGRLVPVWRDGRIVKEIPKEESAKKTAD